MTDIQMVEMKVLSFSDKPDADGDIIVSEAVHFPETLNVYNEIPTPKNFIGFSNPFKKPDGLWIKMPAAMVAKYNGKFAAPQGQCRGVEVVKMNGIPCRKISRLEVSSINLVPRHADNTIPPINVVGIPAPTVVEPKAKKVVVKKKKVVVKKKAEASEPKRNKKSASARTGDQVKRCGASARPGDGGSSRADSGDKAPKKKARFKRRSDRRDSGS